MHSKVYVEITNICNKNCSFCHGHSRELRRMSREEFAHILDRLQGQTKYIYYHLMGEPLTHPQLPEFIRMAGERGYKSILTTNGTLLHRRGEEILAAGLHKVNLSLHSFEDEAREEHERYVAELAAFAIRAAEAGTIAVFRLWNRGCDGGMNDTALSLLQKYIPGEWRENTRGTRLRDKIFLDWGERFEWPDKDAPIKGTRFSCYGLKDQFGILCDGTVVPCCLDSEGGIALGNIFRKDIDAILQSDRATNMVEGFRRGEATEDLCRRCGYARRFV
jgi:radical SAM protein with 4Fe4S-binding SPASM domain